MNRIVLVGSIFIGVVIINLLLFQGLYLFQLMGPGTLFFGHITLILVILCCIGIFAMIACNIKETSQA